MITVEKDAKAEEVLIHATPEDLRELAKKLWQISEKAETKGKHKEQLTSKAGGDITLSSKPWGESRKFTAIKKLTITSRTSPEF